MRRPTFTIFLVAGLALTVLTFGSAGSAAPADSARLTGWFHTIWIDGLPESGITGRKHILIDDQGYAMELHLDDLTQSMGAAQSLNRRRVTVQGNTTSIRRFPTSVDRFQVESIRLETPAEAESTTAEAAQAVTGPKPWVTILCRFGDDASTPQPKSWFEGLMGPTYPGMDHYWREVSYENINLAGSAVVGWYTLPQARAFYIYDRNGDGDTDDIEDIDFQRLVDDCTATADADVFFPAFSGINLMFNDTLGCCSAGGSTTLTRDGQAKMYSVTWMPAFQGPDPNIGGWRDQGILAHEMGHGFGLPHSSGSYSETYDSHWDMMSDPTGRHFGSCSPDAIYGCIGTGTISFHKDLLGWIPPSRRLVAAAGSPASLTLERLNQSSGAGYLMAKIPIGGSFTQFYTVEARHFVGYDARVPGEAVVVHRVDIMRSDRLAQVVDTDNNGNPNDAGAMWLPGETFVDSANGITVSVVSAAATAFQITIQVQSFAAGPTVAAVLPLSRSVQVGGFPATAFAAIINSGSTTATNCAPAPPSSPPAGLGTFSYQTTSPANTLTGTPNTPANIAPGATQNYVFGFAPAAPISETSLAMQFLCDNAAPAPSTPGVNNFFLVASSSPVPDTVALIATLSGDGVVRISGSGGLQVFAIGTANVGATGTLTVSGDTGGVGLPLTLTVCETNAGGICLAAPTPTVTVSYPAGTTKSFAFFSQASGGIPFAPAVNRVFARLRESGVLRGATSAAVCTTPNAGC